MRQPMALAMRPWAKSRREPTPLREPEITASVPEPLDALLAEAAANRPELAAVAARIRVGEAWVRRAERERHPRIRAMFSGGWIRFAELTLSRLLFGGFGIQLPLPMGGRLQANIEETRLGLERT